MKVFIIGSNGYLGKNLKCFFERAKDDVQTATSFSPDKIWIDNILDRIASIVPDVILIPGACQSVNDDGEAIDELLFSNCMLPSKVASFLLRENSKCKLVTFSSSWQFSEDGLYRPFNLYAASKKASEDLLEHFALGGVLISSLTLFDVYGPDDERTKIYNLLTNAAVNKTIIDTTTGDQEIELVHVDDVCRGVSSAIRELGKWNSNDGVMKRGLGHGRPITLKNLIGRIAMASGNTNFATLGVRPYREREIMRVVKSYVRPDGWLPKIDEFCDKS